MDKSWTEANDKVYYYRLVATSIQRSRKNAGLHPWDEINALWEGEPKYPLNSNEAQEYIENITRIKLMSYQDNYLDKNNYSNNNDCQMNIQEKNKLSNIIYSNEYDNIGIKLHLAR